MMLEWRMKRTNVYIDEEQLRVLRHIAVETGRSFTDIVREALNEYMTRRGVESASRVIGPRHTMSDEEWRSRLDTVLERIRAGVPEDLNPAEIEEEITEAWREVREQKALRRARRA